MKTLRAVLTAGVTAAVAALAAADTTTITAGLNAPVIGASGGSQVYWGPIVTQTTLGLSGNTNTLYPQKLAGSSISGSGGAAGSRRYCANPGDPTSGPGTIVAPSTAPVYEWFCDMNPPPAAPRVDFEFYKQLALAQGNVCGGRSCYDASPSPSFSGLYDPACTADGHPKVWFFEGDVSFSGSTYFCGVLLSRGSVSFTGGGAGHFALAPPADAWKQYQVATPNGTPNFGDTNAKNEYPGDDGLNTVASYDFAAGGGGFNGDPVSFQGYIFATTGYTAGGHTLVVGSVQFGQGAASTSGGGTIFYEPQIIFTIPASNTVSAPAIFPPGGTFTGSVTVTMSVATQGASIYYTTDGSAPSAGSTLYTGPITLSADTSVRAIGIRSGWNPSSVTTADFTLLSGPANTAPAVDAGSDQTITLPAGATLSGLATDDGLPNPPASLQYGWNALSGPGTVAFADPSLASTTASFSAPGTYVLRLSAYDGQLTGYDDVQVTVYAVPPPTVGFNPASYTVSEAAGYVRLTVTRSGPDLSGTSTVDLVTDDGTATAGLDYVDITTRLTFAAGESAKTVDVPLLNDRLSEGSETFSATLSSPVGAVLGTQQAQVTLTEAAPAPAGSPAPFIRQLMPYAAPTTFAQVFQMRVSGEDFDASAAQVLWSGTSLPVVSRSSTSIIVNVDPALWNGVAGAYPVIVRNPGNMDSNTATFTVYTPGNGVLGEPFVVQEPMADPNPTYGRTTHLTVLGGTLSPGGESVLRYTWEGVGIQPSGYTFSDSGTNSAKSVTATFAGPGTYRFRVRITDSVTGFTVFSGSLDVTVVATPTTIVVSPKTQVITTDQIAKLSAVVKDQFGNELSPALTWNTSGGSLAASNRSATLSVDSNVRTVRVTASVDSRGLSDYGEVAVLYGSGGVGAVQQSVPAPVPYRSDSGLPGVTFKRLNPGTTIRLFNAAGQQVRTLTSENGADVLWDLKHGNGERASSGVYLYILDWNGLRKKGKLVLIL